MGNGKVRNSCLFGEELVSYIYGEFPVNDRTAFEDHLLSCGECIEEFAAVSESRLGVYEWHRDEFLTLETPYFEIPFRRSVAVSEQSLGWFDALRRLFTPARLAVAGGAFATFAVVFGTIFIVSTPTDQFIADANTTVAPVNLSNNIKETVIPPVNSSEQTESKESFINEFKAEKTSTKRRRSSRLVQAKATTINSVRQNQVQEARSATMPRLGTFDEAEDTSLRLADLVANIDANDF